MSQIYEGQPGDPPVRSRKILVLDTDMSLDQNSWPVHRVWSEERLIVRKGSGGLPAQSFRGIEIH